MESKRPILDYCSASSVGVRRGLYFAALFFILAPLAPGVGCLVGFAVTRDVGFAAGGILVLLLGFVSVVVGIACLWAYWREGRRSPSADKERLTQQIKTAFLLIVVDFVVAILCAVVGILLVTAAGAWVPTPS